ncbi:TrkA family potassium uptake protein [Glutamicibacter creatinolyticus]|uniref:potassium channel family protein n=1 Tax=Glutamicibacter creatinolyticus TaxID=162496 RepID=UPI0033E110B5
MSYLKKGQPLVNVMSHLRPKGPGRGGSVAVIGLGRFGSSLALELMGTGVSVLGIDVNDNLVQALNGELTQVVRADATKREVLEQLSIHEFDRVVVAIGNHLQASILTSSQLIRIGIPHIWAKAQDDQHGLILEQLGVHHIVYPEKDMGRRVAHRVRDAILDYVEIDAGYVLVKASVPHTLQGTRLGDSQLRRRYGVTIAAAAAPDGSWRNADADTVLHSGDRILVLGPIRAIESFGRLLE